MIGQKYSGGVWKVAGFILVRPLITLTFSLQSFGCQFLGQFQKLAVFLSDILVICIQVLPFFVALLRLIKETTKKATMNAKQSQGSQLHAAVLLV